MWSDKLLSVPLKKGSSSEYKGKNILINEEVILQKSKKKSTLTNGVDCNILSHLQKILAQLKMNEALLISKELIEILIHVLHYLGKYVAYYGEGCIIEVI